MEENRILFDFFNRNFEKIINEKMMYYSYDFEFELVKNFILTVTNLPLIYFLNYMREHYNVHFLEPKDVIQFSNLNDCTTNICTKIKMNGDTGFNALEIGRMLEDDGVERKSGALVKYGENHAKTATELGLLQCLNNKFFLSCFGYVFNELDEENQINFLIRLILRNKLVWRLIYKAITNGSSNYYSETGFLSESTQLRRKSNVKQLLNFLHKTNDKNMNDVLDLITFNI